MQYAIKSAKLATFLACPTSLAEFLLFFLCSGLPCNSDVDDITLCFCGYCNKVKEKRVISRKCSSQPNTGRKEMDTALRLEREGEREKKKRFFLLQILQLQLHFVVVFSALE